MTIHRYKVMLEAYIYMYCISCWFVSVPWTSSS